MDPELLSSLYDEELKKISSPLLLSVISTIPDGVHVLKAIRNNKGKIEDYEYIIANAPAHFFSGVTSLAGKKFSEINPSEQKTLLRMKETTETGKSFEITRFSDSSGRPAWLHSRFVKFGDGILFTTLEVTELKSQAERVAREQWRFEQAERLSNLGSFDYDIQEKKLRWSNQMFRIHGLVPQCETMTLDKAAQFIHEGDMEKYNDHIKNAFAGKESRLNTKIRLRDGSEKVFSRMIVPLLDPAGNAYKLYGFAQDITSTYQQQGDKEGLKIEIATREKIRELNDKLIRHNVSLEVLNSEIRTFSAIAANHYNETLKHLYTNLEYVAGKEAGHLSETGKTNIRRAQSEIQKLKLLTEDIISYSRIYDIDAEPSLVNLSKVFDNVVESLSEKLAESGASVQRNDLPVIEGRPTLISLLFYNLLDNAIKFRKQIKSPEIMVKVSRADELNMLPQAMKDTPYFIISVIDNGIGFDEVYSDKIFDLFFRIPSPNRYKGSGVGLALCKRILQLHYGFITAESNPSSGSTFNCFFPQQ